MRFSTSLLYSIATALVSTSTVDAGCQYIGGNYYCNSVSAVQYQNVGFSGSYNDVTNMDETTCQCSSSPKSFSGTLSPLDEELSIHFRGPIKLAQFGVYYPASSKMAKRDFSDADAAAAAADAPVADASSDAAPCVTTKHIHHRHKRAPVIEYEYVTETVPAGQNINPAGPSSSTAPTGQPAPLYGPASSSGTTLLTSTLSQSYAPGPNTATFVSSGSTTGASPSASSSSSSSSSPSSGSGGDWVRSSYFTPGSADGLVFLNSKGGSAGSGTWSSCFGNSLSYCASDGVNGAASAQALGDVTIDSDVEFMIFHSSLCSDSSISDCGYYRSDIPAHHGFAGAEKVFVFEFQMPSNSGSSFNGDMPAIWMLNAKIPRTLQYGNSACSCWSTGCGEFDIFEILSAGSDKLISHLHDGQGSTGSYGGGGTSDYFSRPYGSTMKAAVVFQDGNISIVVLDDDTTFGSSLSASTVNGWASTSGTQVSI
ncbi:hypothetical protein PICMEDRAFT_18063 [Pichia membranifaciens NRRL Y-2026]|uniref:glucan endo-1,3-beta-D-glucosidase n=1 Tax=Pichia membranifaciens NRRL Y-2026 TaxID=763406 RepID=A0A1E3NET8_9ASCO|nr:hypothetical protein PICMEDRAFT_18063 [Pichia membranifaciens NRRL Y-2026]ODQ44657.1 hypothetical protein PICMEDRAFT_18063 [Pichia membranifaciens NRRL Y-2026]